MVRRKQRGRGPDPLCMGLKSKSKGKRGEREVVALARAHALPAERTWHTAQSASPAERASDVRMNSLTTFYRVLGSRKRARRQRATSNFRKIWWCLAIEAQRNKQNPSQILSFPERPISKALVPRSYCGLARKETSTDRSFARRFSPS